MVQISQQRSAGLTIIELCKKDAEEETHNVSFAVSVTAFNIGRVSQPKAKYVSFFPFIARPPHQRFRRISQPQSETQHDSEEHKHYSDSEDGKAVRRMCGPVGRVDKVTNLVCFFRSGRAISAPT